jgi:hypothetical protein
VFLYFSFISGLNDTKISYLPQRYTALGSYNLGAKGDVQWISVADELDFSSNARHGSTYPLRVQGMEQGRQFHSHFFRPSAFHR